MTCRKLVIVCLLPLVALSGCKTIRLVSLVKSSRQHREQSPLTAVAGIPFTYEREWIVLQVRVRQNGRQISGDFLFDTGAFTKLFDSTGDVQVQRMSRVAKMPIQGAFGTVYRPPCIAKDVYLAVGALEVLKPRLLVSERPHFFPAHWQGIIGADFFHRHTLTIDFKARMLYAYPDDFYKPEGQRTLKLKTIGNHNPVARNVQLGDMPAMDYLLDLGNTGSVLIQQASPQALSAALGSGVREYAVSQAGTNDASGKMNLSRYCSKSVTSVNGVPCTAFEVVGLQHSGGLHKYGNMGLGFLSKVFETFTIDWKHSLLQYKLSQPQGSESFDRDVYFKEEKGRFFTGPVLVNSTWYRQGLRPGMEVRLINGRDPYLYMAGRKAANAAPLDTITLTTTAEDLVITRQP